MRLGYSFTNKAKEKFGALLADYIFAFDNLNE
jgi:hypothetical protein